MQLPFLFLPSAEIFLFPKKSPFHFQGCAHVCDSMSLISVTLAQEVIYGNMEYFSVATPRKKMIPIHSFSKATISY